MWKIEYNLLQPGSCAFRDVHIVLIAYLKYIKKEKNLHNSNGHY